LFLKWRREEEERGRERDERRRTRDILIFSFSGY